MVLDPATLLPLLVSYFLGLFRASSIKKIMLSVNADNFISSFKTWILFLSFLVNFSRVSIELNMIHKTDFLIFSVQ